MGKKKDKPNLLRETLRGEIEKAYERWWNLKTHGGSDPFWEDGVNMNLVRNHIKFWKREIFNKLDAEDWPEALFWIIPPEVHPKYMADPDGIRKAAAETLGKYEADADYQWLVKYRNQHPVRPQEVDIKLTVIGYVDGLRRSIENDELVYMRRHRDPGRYIESFRESREAIEKLNGQERELPEGQLSLFDIM